MSGFFIWKGKISKTYTRKFFTGWTSEVCFVYNAFFSIIAFEGKNG
jgi:hypothetical protein